MRSNLLSRRPATGARYGAVLALLVGLTFSAHAQVGIGTTTPDASAVAEFSSTTKGLLVPRMTSAQRAAITSPAVGLLVYQTDGSAGFYFYSSGGWTWLDPLGGADNLGNHTATQNLDLGANLLVGNGGAAGIGITSTGKVGIGTTAPGTTLQVASGDVAFSATGDVPASPAAPGVTGAGRRLFWYPDKAAFRAGYVNGTEWDQANVGTYSTAVGYRTIANGDYSFAAGNSSVASGENTVALGAGTASAYGATAIGIGSQATGENSVALGQSGIAGGLGAITLGLNIANGNYGVAIGVLNSAHGMYSMALGKNARAIHQGTVVIGDASAGFSADSVYTTTTNQFVAAFAGGYRFNTKRTPATTSLSISGTGKVGIGTSSPSTTLQVVSGDVAFSATGDVPASPTAPGVTGAGRRLLWYPDKAAFRAGYVDGTQWDQANTGKYSTAIGYNTIASGEDAFASGSGATASAQYAIASGYLTSASGVGAIAIGSGALASGDDALALGPSSIATGVASIVLGPSRAKGSFGVAIGLQNAAYGNFATAIGKNARANKQGSFVIGDASAGSASDSVSSTVNNQLVAAFAGGYLFNTKRAPATTTLAISSTGQVGIGTSTPTATLEVSGATSTVKLAGLAGTGTRVVTATVDGELATVTTASLADNLGNHTATQKLDLSTFKLVGNGGTTGLSISSAGAITTDVALTTGSTLTTGGAITAGGKIDLGTFKLAGNGGTTGLSISNAGAITTDGSLTTGGAITAGGALTTGGTITAGGKVDLGTNSLVGNGGTLGLTISSAGVTTAGGNLNLGANRLVGNGGTSGVSITSGGQVGVGSLTPALGQLSNTTTNIIGVDGNGVNFTSGVGSLMWAMSANGYVGAFYNGSTASNGNGLAVKIDGTSSSASALDVSKGAQASTGTSLLMVKATGFVGIGTSTPATHLDVDGAMTVRDNGSTTSLTADDQTVTVGDRTYVRLTSTSGTATQRTVVLSDGLRSGQLLIIENAGGSNSFEVGDGGTTNANTNGSISLGPGDTITLIWNGTDWIELNSSNN